MKDLVEPVIGRVTVLIERSLKEREQLTEEAGLAQSKIPDLTERQLRRIEQGEGRATSKALAALAAAHGLALDDYLDRLAKAMK